MKFWIALVVIVAGLVIAGGVSKALRPLPPGAAASAMPDCLLPEDMHPTALFALVNSKKEEYQSMYSSMLGCMVPAAGWEGQVTAVDGNKLRFEVGSGIGAYTIDIIMRETPSIQPGSTVKYRGRLVGATSKVVMGNVLSRIELSDGEIVP